MPRFSIARPSKIYPNWDFGFENKPSGNPGGMYFLRAGRSKWPEIAVLPIS
jgi:hypothetical protein